MKNSEIFEKEKKLVESLFKDPKNTYRKVADKLGKSIYWVYTRKNNSYGPNLITDRIKFENNFVIPFLKNKKHIIYAKTEIKRTCIISKLQNTIYISEIIDSLNSKAIRESIGYLILESFLHDDPILNLFIPIKYKNNPYIIRLHLNRISIFGINIIYL